VMRHGLIYLNQRAPSRSNLVFIRAEILRQADSSAEV
jgi:hypothetical protein